ncbi:immune-induced peptide 14 [Drosophila subobscura]|uniref:immune-induced peptide 14 n=1 Tax=Drosophila subobscura TaxID=7241 RepID=UPI00155AFD74|nr:immune-induced peptide 14 [Drosophila subobscura]
MNCLKICGFVFALIAALSTAEAATQVLNAGGHTLIQTDRTQYIRKTKWTLEINQINRA